MKLYTLGAADITAAAGHGLGTPVLAGWRHMLRSDGEVVAADVSTDAAGTDHTFAALRADSSAQAIETAIDALSHDPETATISYEVSLLNVPALGVKALWLHAPTVAARDIVVPLPPVRSELVAGRHYSPAEFTSALKDAAAKILVEDNPRKGSG